MIEALSAGVYTQFVDKSLYSASSLPLTLLLLGTSHRGTTEPFFCTNPDDFLKEFGTPTTDSYLHYAALSFLNRGRSLWVRRIASIAAVEASVNVNDISPATTLVVKSKSKGDYINGYKIDVLTDSSVNILSLSSIVSTINFIGTVAQPVNVTGVVLSNPTGASGAYNLVYTATGSTLAWGGGTPVAVGAGGQFVLTATGGATVVANVTTGSLPVANQTDTGLTVTLTVDNANPNIPGLVFTTPVGNIGQHTLTYTYTSSTNITIKIDSGTASASIHSLSSVTVSDAPNSITVKIMKDGFKLVVKDPNNLIVETIDKLVKDPNNANFHVTRVGTLSTYINTTDTGSNYNNPAVTTTSYILSGGNAGMSGLTDADYIGVYTTTSKTGLNGFTDTETYDLNFVAIPGNSSINVVTAMLSFCELRGDCMSIIDTPSGITAEQAVQWTDGSGAYVGQPVLNSMFGLTIHDWAKYYDPYSASYLYLPPSVTYLNLLANAYYNGKQYQAIAGYERGRITDALDVQSSPSLGQRDLMLGDGTYGRVNPIVRFVRDGLILFGEKTLQKKNSSTNRAHAVITLLYIFRQVNTLAKRVLFEPNDATTWRALSALIDPVLADLKSPSKRALYDYKFVCDSSTNTPDLIDQNKLAAKLFVKFSKNAEMILIDIIATNTGADFSLV